MQTENILYIENIKNAENVENFEIKCNKIVDFADNI